MGPRLALISKQIHWSLLIRSVLFAASWLYLPGWLFVLVASAVYFFPPFESRKNLAFFLVFLGVALATPGSILMAVLYGALWYYLLLIKDLLVIDRKSGRTILAMAIAFFLFREFFAAWHAGFSSGALFWVWVVAAAFGILLNAVIVARHGKEVSGREALPRRIAVGTASLAVLELLMAGLFLPVDFIYQSIVAFLAAALVLDLVPAYFFGELDPRRIRTTAMAIAILFVIVLASAKWGI